MKYYHRKTCSIAFCMMFITTTVLGQMQGQPVPLPGLAQAPQVKENFRVIVQKDPKSPDVKFYYVFCNTTELQTQCLDSAASPIKNMHSTRNSASSSNGF